MYIMQVQAQLFCTGANYCDFIVYTKESIHIEWIRPDTIFWEENVGKVKNFFQTGLSCQNSLEDGFLALQSKLHIHHLLLDNPPPHCTLETASPSSHDSSSNYCYCQEDEHGLMVGCDNRSCPYQWFHLECLKLKSAPRMKKWYCPDCRKIEKFKKVV